MIGIVDYGLGNIRAFDNVYSRLGIPCKLVKREEDFDDVTRIILPGVGAFDSAIQMLNDSGMYEILNHLVLVEKKPVLGVCVGMQIMGFSSEEGTLDGLGWVPGYVKKITRSLDEKSVFLPHMGWNTIHVQERTRLFTGLDEDIRFYFLHSYYFEPESATHSYSTTNYASTFSSSIRLDHIYGVQFHPEKSHKFGIQLLKNFSEV